VVARFFFFFFSSSFSLKVIAGVDKSDIKTEVWYQCNPLSLPLFFFLPLSSLLSEKSLLSRVARSLWKIARLPINERTHAPFFFSFFSLFSSVPLDKH